MNVWSFSLLDRCLVLPGEIKTYCQEVQAIRQHGFVGVEPDGCFESDDPFLRSPREDERAAEGRVTTR